MQSSLFRSSNQSDLPLCRSYVAILFNPISVQFSPIGGAGQHSVPMLCALGVLAGCLPDYLGSWQFSGSKGSLWHAIACDLQDRGVERLRIVIGPDPVEIEAAIAPRYRNNVVLPASATLERPEIKSTLSGHRPYIERALDVTTALSVRLKRAAARHGPFADAPAAAALLRRSAERYIYREWPEPGKTGRALRSPSLMALTAAFR